MDPYRRLLEDARNKRNQIISKARQEYAQSVRKIKDLASRLDSKSTLVDPKPKIIVDVIVETIPRDRLFRIAEVIDLVQRANPSRVFTITGLTCAFHKLIRRGDIVRITRDDAGYVLYAAATYQAPPTEFGMMTTAEVAELILGERGPLRSAELVVLMQERGYKSTADPQQLLNAVKLAIGRQPQRFVANGPKWSLIGEPLNLPRNGYGGYGGQGRTED
jgi:hypothetical protein